MNLNNYVPADFIVAGNQAFFLRNNTVMAAPVLTRWGGEIEWTEAVQVVRQDPENTALMDSIFTALHMIASA